MSCGVMYQSHYSYFPYQRNLLSDHQTSSAKEVLPEPVHGRGGEGGVAAVRESPAPFTFPARHASPPATYASQAILGLPSSFTREHEQDPEFSQRSAGDGKVKGEKDKDCDVGQRTAQYVSANCVIFTYYSGDISKAVDDHFSKALSQSTDADTVPLSARNLPASFWDSNWVPPPSLHSPELYGDYSDPWQSYMASMTGYSAHQMYTARSYSSLLLQSRREWVEQNYSASPYPAMSAGLEGGMQNGGKDLYWF